jgi:phosphoribosylaminoimidazolecarboxamide formyltransferase/IMP cyclohydrolase
MQRVKRALISVSDKRDLVRFAKELKKLGIEIISTGGTARVLTEAGVKVTEVSQITRFPEMLDGRVKTLHPVIAAGILADRRQQRHLEQLAEQHIEPIDLVVVNLYPFAETVAKPGVTLEEAIENIDIGGPTMIRAAAKNFESVAVVVEPERYQEVLEELRRNNGAISREMRFSLAIAAFKHTAEYDETIYEYLAELTPQPTEFPDLLKLVFVKIQDLRYGENPHQRAAYYREERPLKSTLVQAKQLHGKELSFNNLLDLDAAWAIASGFERPAAVIIKHNNPCGVAISNSIAQAYELAYEADSVSAFGGIVALNQVVDEEVAKKIAATYIEAIIAPAYQEEALEILTAKKGIRIMYLGEEARGQRYGLDFRRVNGGILVQDFDQVGEKEGEMEVVTERQPSEGEWQDLLFAWKVAAYVKSNAVVLAKNGVTVGIGAGQMSRVDATYLALYKAGREKARNAVLASDAFFPFRDAIDLAAKAGVKAIIQPGGSVRDEEVITACKEHGLAMVFTGRRHFRH